jgi:hypothetical protein
MYNALLVTINGISAYYVQGFLGGHEGKTLLVRSIYIFENNIKTNLKVLGWEDVDRIHLARCTLNMIINILVR